MRKVMVLCFAFVLVLSMVAVAQDAAQPTSAKQDSAQSAAKADTVSGKVSDDGKTLTDNKGKSWTVSNPEALKGHEGHEVTVKGHTDPAENEINVTSVKMKKEKS